MSEMKVRGNCLRVGYIGRYGNTGVTENRAKRGVAIKGVLIEIGCV